LEKKLNINIEFTNRIQESLVKCETTEILDKMERAGNMQFDKNVTGRIVSALTEEGLSQEEKNKYIQFLAEFYVSKTYGRSKIFGFMTGQQGALTHGLSNLQFRQAITI